MLVQLEPVFYLYPGAAAGGALALAVLDDYLSGGVKYVPDISKADYISIVNEILIKPQIERATDDFDKVYNSYAKNILSPRTEYNGVNRRVITKLYLDEMEVLMRMQSENREYIEALMFLGIDMKGADEYVSSITK